MLQARKTAFQRPAGDWSSYVPDLYLKRQLRKAVGIAPTWPSPVELMCRNIWEVGARSSWEDSAATLDGFCGPAMCCISLTAQAHPGYSAISRRRLFHGTTANGISEYC